MTTVANCYDLSCALRLKLAMEAEGIPAFIPDEASAGMAPFLMASTGVRVQVEEQHVEAAKRIVAEEQPEALPE